MSFIGYLDTMATRRRIMNAFTNSTQCGTTIEASDYNGIPENVEWVSAMGVLRGAAEIYKDGIACEKTKFIFLDNAFWNASAKFMRYSIDRHNPGEIKERDNKRWPNITLSKWKSNRGDNILILPPSGPVIKLMNCDTWLDDTISKLKKVTDRLIIVRPKPSIRERHLVPNLDKQLIKSYAVVTYNSNVCIDALIKGIPIYCDPEGSSNNVSFNLDNIETDIQEPDRERFIRHLSYHQFSVEEMANGTAWGIISE